MLQFGRLERLAIGAFTVTLLMLAATIALASTSELHLGQVHDEQEVTAPFRSVLNCVSQHQSADTVRTTFVLLMTPSGVVTSGAVLNEKVGTCVSNTASATDLNEYAIAYSFIADGKACKAKPGEVSFSFVHDARFGNGQSATLSIKDVTYICRR